MPKKIYDQDITIDQDWNGDKSTDGMPVSGRAVQKFIKERLRTPLVQVYDGNSRLYRYFSDPRWAAECQAIIDAGEPMTAEVLAEQVFTDPAPAPYVVSVLNAKVGGKADGASILQGVRGTYLTFGWQTTNDSGVPLMERVDVVITFTNGGASQQIKNTYRVGATANILIDDYLRAGQNEITIVVTGQQSSATGMTALVCNVVAMGLSSIFSVAQSLTPDADTGLTLLNIDYTAWGGYDKTVEFYIDGGAQPVARQLWGSLHNPSQEQAGNDTQSLMLDLAAGTHTLQLRMMVELDGELFYTDTLGYKFVVTGIVQQQIMVAFEGRGGRILTAVDDIVYHAEQYKYVQIVWGYYTSDMGNPTATVEWRMKGADGQYTVIGTRTATTVDATNNVAPEPLRFAPSQAGDFDLEAWVGDTMLDSFKLVVAESSQRVEQQTGAIFDVTATGRSNDEPDELFSTWVSGTHAAVFHGTHAWEDGALVLMPGSWVEFPTMQALNQNPKGRGFTLSVSYATFAADADDVPVIEAGNAGEGHITVCANRARLTSAYGSSVYTDFQSGDRQTTAFVITPSEDSGLANGEPQVMFIQTDGVRERANNYGSTDSFTSDGALRFGDPTGHCGVRIYGARIYASALSRDALFQNFAIDSPDRITTLLEANDVLDPQTGRIAMDKLVGKVDVLRVTGPVNQLFNNTDDAQIHVRFERDAVDPYASLTIEGMRMTNPGQSTRGFGISQQRGYTDKDGCIPKDYNGVVLQKGYYSIHTGGIPEKKFRLNPQFVDSSMALAATFYHMVNRTSPLAVMDGQYYLRTKAQDYVLSGRWARDMADTWGGDASQYVWPYTDRYGGCGLLTVPDPLPAVEFWRSDDTKPYSYLSQFTIAHEKKSPRTFGQRSINIKKPISDGVFDPFDLQTGLAGVKGWDNRDCMQFEILQNAEELAMMRDMTDWSKPRYDKDGQLIGLANEQVFEQQYPDTDDQTEQEQAATRQRFKQLCDWWAACYQVDGGGAASRAKFQAEASAHLDLPKWGDYYIKMLKNMMVDNAVRNMQLTTEDGQHWYPKYWDADVQFGIRNDGPLVFAPGIDRQSKDPDDPTQYAFAGHDAWMWNALESWPWFMNTLVPKCNQSLVNAGWTRKAFVDEFTSFVSHYPERLYNESMQTKYVEQYFDGKDYLPFMKGRMLNYIRYMVAENYAHWDAEWCSGEYASDSLYLRCGGTPNGRRMYFKAAKPFTFGWALTDTSRIQQKGIRVTMADPRFEFVVALTGETSTLGVNDPVVIYGPNALEEIDLHELARYFSATLQFDKHYDTDLGTNLKVLNIGISKDEMRTVSLIPTAWDEDGNATAYDELPVRNYQKTLAFSGMNTMTRLEVLNVQGLKGMDASRLDNLKYMTSLREFYGAGANVVSFEPAAGRTFDVLELPDTVRSISMTNCSWRALRFYDDNIDECAVPSTLTDVYLRNVGSSVQIRDFVSQWADAVSRADNRKLFNCIISNAYFTGMSYETLMRLALIPRAQRQITGYLEIDSAIDSERMSTLRELYGDTIFDANAPLRISTSVPTFSVSVSGADVFTDEQGRRCILAGGTAQVSAVIFPFDYGSRFMWAMDNATTSGSILSVKTLDFDTRTGTITTLESGIEDYDVTIRATDGQSSGEVMLRVVRRVYPSAVRIAPIDDDGRELPLVDGQFPISKEAYYLFRTFFTVDGEERPDFRAGEGRYGAFRPQPDGWAWLYSDADTNRSIQCQVLSHHRSVGLPDEYLFCLRVVGLPQEEVVETIGYWSEFVNGAGRITAAELPLLMYSVFRVIGNLDDAFGGNMAIYRKLLAQGIEPADGNYITNEQLRTAVTELTFADGDGLTGFATTVYDAEGERHDHPNILRYLKALRRLVVHDLSYGDSVLYASIASSLEEVDMESTYASVKL